MNNMNKCSGYYNCYPDCSECGRLNDDCDGCDEYINSLPEEQSSPVTPISEPGI